MDEQSLPPPLHVWVGTAAAAALILAAGWAGYGAGRELAPPLIIKEPYEVAIKVPVETRVEVPVDRPVPGPTVYVPVPGPTIVKKIFVRAPRHCPTPAAPSIADALNEYEALANKEGKFQCRKTL